MVERKMVREGKRGNEVSKMAKGTAEGTNEYAE